MPGDAILLQRQYMVIQKPETEGVEILNEHLPFLYKFVGTWAFAPHPKHWREFLDWFNSVDNEKFDPYVPGLITSDWLHMHTSMNKRHMTWVRLKGHLWNDKVDLRHSFRNNGTCTTANITTSSRCISTCPSGGCWPRIGASTACTRGAAPTSGTTPSWTTAPFSFR